MPINSIGLITSNQIEKTSMKAICWLNYISNSEKIIIIHAKNNGEFKIGNYKVDGYCQMNKTIYEFHGCFYHGCPKCFRPETWNNLKQSTMGYIYKQHINRISYLKKIISIKNNIYNVENLVEKWECEWDKDLKNNDHIQAFLPIS